MIRLPQNGAVLTEADDKGLLHIRATRRPGAQRRDKDFLLLIHSFAHASAP